MYQIRSRLTIGISPQNADFSQSGYVPERVRLHALVRRYVDSPVDQCACRGTYELRI